MSTLTKWPLTTLFINGFEKYPMIVADILAMGVMTKWAEVQNVLTHLTIRERV